MIPPEVKAKIESDLAHFREIAKDWRPCCSRLYRADGDRLALDEDAVDEYYEEPEDDLQPPRTGTSEAYLQR